MFLISALLNGESLDSSMDNARIAYSSHKKSLPGSFLEGRNQVLETTSSADFLSCDIPQAIDVDSRVCKD